MGKSWKIIFSIATFDWRVSDVFPHLPTMLVAQRYPRELISDGMKITRLSMGSRHVLHLTV